MLFFSVITLVRCMCNYCAKERGDGGRSFLVKADAGWVTPYARAGKKV